MAAACASGLHSPRGASQSTLSFPSAIEEGRQLGRKARTGPSVLPSRSSAVETAQPVEGPCNNATDPMLCSSRHLFILTLVTEQGCLTGSTLFSSRLLHTYLVWDNNSTGAARPGLRTWAARPVVRLALVATAVGGNATVQAASSLSFSFPFFAAPSFLLLLMLQSRRHKFIFPNAPVFTSSTLHFPVTAWWLGRPGAQG
jgi:hypothetical protein